MSDAYEREIERRSGPFGLPPARTRLGAAAQVPLYGVEGIGNAAEYFLDLPTELGEASIDYLLGPSEFQRDLEAGLIPESEIPLGVDLADIPGSGVGVPDYVPDDYVPGEVFKYDPSGDGISKDINDLLAPISTSGPKTRNNRAKYIKEKMLQAQIAADKAIDSKINKDATILKNDESSIVVPQEKIEEAAISAFNDYLGEVRGSGPNTPKVKDIDDYKKQFAEATGINISGNVDKSHALMTFGLALMQNKAGKGFNVAKMLSSIGKAGQAALPALEKAKTEARANVLAAGKYALEAQAADQAKADVASEKAMNRKKYWVFKKGKKGEEFSNFDNGEFADLNAYELDKLINNPDFDKNYEFIDARDRFSILEKRAEVPDLGNQWKDPKIYSTIGGKPEDTPIELQVLAAARDPNYTGSSGARFKLIENPETILKRYAEFQQDINSGAQKFERLIANLNEGVSVPKQILSGMQQALRNFGVPISEMPSTVADAKRLLNNLAIDEATNILQESGKTLSDRDRELVAKRIGAINWTSGDVEIIKSQLKDIYDLTVIKPQRNLDRSIEWLEKNTNISFVPALPTQEELDAMNEANGTSYTLDDFK